MIAHTHHMVNGLRVELSAEEAAELNARVAAYVPPAEPLPAPTKEQLMAELAALTAKIQALE
ncbi:hypothetical protein EBZ39_15320 [bacterium]|nr:hypothetical protein [bacterium]